MATYISKNFALEEFEASDTAKARHISNAATPDAIIALTYLCINVLQPLRDWFGCEIKIGSGYRSKALNRAVGGVSNSQHMEGKAVDLCIDGDMAKGRRWFEYIRDHLPFDQLIWEHNAKGTYWVHVSFNWNGRNRRQVINNLLKS